MSNSGSGNNNSNQQPSIKITLPNPNALHHYAKPPASPPRSTNAGGSYPFPGAYNSQSKSHHSKLPSPSHLLSQNQDNYLNSPPPSILNAYSYSSESPDSSPRHSSRENHYSLPSLNMSNMDPLPGRTTPPPHGRPSMYSNPIPFVNSSPSSYASHPPRPFKPSGNEPNQSPTHYSANSFSPPMPRHSKHGPLPSPPDSPSHDAYPQHSNVFPRYPANFPQPQKFSYMDSPSHPGSSSANSSPKISHSNSPTITPAINQYGAFINTQTPQSPKIMSSAHQIPPSPLHHQSQEVDDEYEEVCDEFKLLSLLY